jgi:tetratricopeptide (TPR) repeat protein
MLKKTISLLILVVVVVTVLYLASSNTSQVVLKLSPQREITASLGVLTISCFALGALFATMIASIFSLRAYLREKQLLWKDKRSQNFWRQIVKARGLSATGDIKRAKNLWSDILSSDPTNTIARIELAKALANDNQTEEAIKLVDEARAADKSNLEALMLAYELNLKENNLTVALDNLALIIQTHPTGFVLNTARELAEQIGKIPDALKYHEMLYSMGLRDDKYDDIKGRLELKLLLIDLEDSDTEAKYKALKNFVKRHTEPQAYVQLAEIENLRGNINSAASYLVEAAKFSGNSEYWYEAAKIWLRNNMPENALSAAKAATYDSKGNDRVRAELDLIRLYIALGQLDMAEKALDAFSQVLNKEGIEIDDTTAGTALALKGLCLNRQSKYKEASEIWKKLSKNEFDIEEPDKFLANGTEFSAPAPRLSTP